MSIEQNLIKISFLFLSSLLFISPSLYDLFQNHIKKIIKSSQYSCKFSIIYIKNIILFIRIQILVPMHLSSTAKGNILTLIFRFALQNIKDLFQSKSQCQVNKYYLINNNNLNYQLFHKKNQSTKIIQIAQRMSESKLTNLKMEIIREIEIFYYSSLSQIFINTCIIDLCECQFFPVNIKVKKTQLNEPVHHELGQLPILLVNKANIIARQNIWELIISIMNIQLNKRYEFLSVIKVCEELAIAATLCSEIDLNPYFLLISPWKKYKMYRHNQKLKAFFHQNTQYLNKNDSTLNKEYFLYKLNILARLLKTYEASTKEELFTCYQIFSFALLKHLKMLDQVLLQTALANQTLKKNYEKMKQNMLIKPQIQKPLRPVSFSNIQLPYLNIPQQPKQQNEQKYDPNRPYQKILQRLFKPIFTTTVLGLAYLAMR